MANFVGKLPSSVRGELTQGGKVGFVIIFKMNPFTVQGKEIPGSVREKIIESWLEGKGQTIANIVDNFIRRGNSEAKKGGNETRLVCTLY